MKRNYFGKYFKTILALFALAIFIGGTAASAQVNPAQAQYRKALDYDGDGKVDMTVVRPNNSGSKTWYTRNSLTGTLKATPWGSGQFLDFPVGGDFDGDGKADITIIRREGANQVWHILQSTGGYRSVTFGLQLDGPMPGDWDGDGKTDIAVERNGGTFIDYFIIQSSNNQFVSRRVTNDPDTPNNCGTQTGIDIDGDGKQDFAQICVNSGGGYLWSIVRSSNGARERYTWGVSSTDRLAFGDYDGDGKTDIGVTRRVEAGAGFNKIWYIRRSSDGALQTVQFGASDGTYYDVDAQADYDGDGKTDIAVYRDSGVNNQPNYFYILRSGSGNSLQAVQWGTHSDEPVRIYPGVLTF